MSVHEGQPTPPLFRVVPSRPEHSLQTTWAGSIFQEPLLGFCPFLSSHPSPSQEDVLPLPLWMTPSGRTASAQPKAPNCGGEGYRGFLDTA